MSGWRESGHDTLGCALGAATAQLSDGRLQTAAREEHEQGERSRADLAGGHLFTIAATELDVGIGEHRAVQFGAREQERVACGCAVEHWTIFGALRVQGDAELTPVLEDRPRIDRTLCAGWTDREAQARLRAFDLRAEMAQNRALGYHRTATQLNQTVGGVLGAGRTRCQEPCGRCRVWVIRMGEHANLARLNRRLCCFGCA